MPFLRGNNSVVSASGIWPDERTYLWWEWPYKGGRSTDLMRGHTFGGSGLTKGGEYWPDLMRGHTFGGSGLTKEGGVLYQ